MILTYESDPMNNKNSAKSAQFKIISPALLMSFDSCPKCSLTRNDQTSLHSTFCLYEEMLK